LEARVVVVVVDSWSRGRERERIMDGCSSPFDMQRKRKN